MQSARIVFVLSLAAAVFSPGCSADPAADEKGPCANGVQDVGESGVDCGGACGKCPGEACVASGECGSGACDQGVCKPPIGGPGPNGGGPSATDGQKNNGETDVDCGGPNAPPCADTKTCGADADCATGWCKPEANTCIKPTSDDGFKNGTETDVDCGGASGKKCAEGLVCAADADCIGACNYEMKCVDAPSCKPRLGGDTCGTKALHAGEFGDSAATAKRESCCRSLPVTGYTDPRNPGKTVLVDKYEITAGRIRAFVEALAAANNGEPNIKAWVAANKPPLWDASWDLFLATGATSDNVVVPRQPSNPAEPAPWNRNVGTNFAFGAPLFVYVHGHNCGNPAGSYGYPTFWYPDAVMTGRGEVARAAGSDSGGTSIPAKDVLDVKSMTCVPSAVLAAFCHWDGGQLATDEVLDFITNAAPALGSAAGCGTRCAPLADIQQSSDSGNDSGIKYRFPFYANTATHEGTSRIATPGRVFTDVVRINAADEPWMDIHGNVHEVVLDVNGNTFGGKFALKYRGIGYNSARAGGNNTGPKYSFPEYKAAYAGGRCMRFK